MSPWHLKQAARVIHGGGIVAYPTEAVYGLGCDPLNAHAVLELLALKARDVAKGVILIAADIQQLEPYLATPAEGLAPEIVRTWPGPVTWLLPAAAHTPRWLTGEHDTIAVRVTAHPLAAALCRAADQALVSTSANLSARPPARTALDVRRIFGDRVDYILHGATGGLGRPTEIRNGRSGKVVRRG